MRDMAEPGADPYPGTRGLCCRVLGPTEQAGCAVQGELPASESPVGSGWPNHACSEATQLGSEKIKSSSNSPPTHPFPHPQL